MAKNQTAPRPDQTAAEQDKGERLIDELLLPVGQRAGGERGHMRRHGRDGDGGRDADQDQGSIIRKPPPTPNMPRQTDGRTQAEDQKMLIGRSIGR